MTLYRITGIVLILLPVAFNAVFFALGRAFDYPNILRQPTDTILKRFSEGGARLRLLWYAFAWTALLAIPAGLLFALSFAETQPLLAAASGALGVLSGLVQAMGLFRWTFVVPILAARYNDRSATPATKDAVAVVFSAFHEYIGVAVGEHLGYLFTGAWTILICAVLLTSPMFSPILGVVGVIAALGILTGMAEPFGWKPAGMINAMSYILWSVWLIACGIGLLAA